jgi:hypothetical protein
MASVRAPLSLAGLALSVAALGAVSGCASGRTSSGGTPCQRRADAAYRACTDRFHVGRDEVVEATRSDAAEACRLAHQTALAECGGGEAPLSPDPIPGARTATTAD